MQSLKTLTYSLIIGLTLAGGITFAAWATNVWNPTDDWIQDGSAISAQKIAENFEYLLSLHGNNCTVYNEKIMRFNDGVAEYCNGTDWVLAVAYEWNISDWGVCSSTVNYTHPNADSAFGCAGSGWRNLNVQASGANITLSATDLRADYRWKGSGASATGVIGAGDLTIIYAAGRDSTQLKLSTNKNLYGRCKTYTSWSLLKSSVYTTAQSRTVECNDTYGVVVDDSYCADVKPEVSQSCS